MKKLKTQEKTQNSSKKLKTQGLGGTRLFPLPKWCYKKKPALPSIAWINQLDKYHLDFSLDKGDLLSKVTFLPNYTHSLTLLYRNLMKL